MRELPLKFPPIETYQGSAFLIGVFFANPNYENIQYNGYIDVIYEKNAPNLTWLSPRFTNSMWDDYRLEGLGEMNLYDICNFTRASLVDFMHERIDQDCYLLLYDVDEYYLSNGEKYQKEHINHDTYIYGYTDEDFLVLAYTGEHLERIIIPNQEIVDALFSEEARKNDDGRRHFSTFRPILNKRIDIDTDLILKGIRGFYEPRNVDNQDNSLVTVSGIGVYDEIMRCLENMREGECMDLRAMRVIWEQKKLMVNRIKKVFPEISDKCVASMQYISDRVRLIFKLMMKYNLSNKRYTVERICSMIKEVRDEDLRWYQTYFKEESLV